jgi:hypothetical protein
MPHRSSVRPHRLPLTEEAAREIIAKPLLKACSAMGPKSVALALGCNEKTVRNSRDEKSTLGLDSAANLLALDPLAFEGFLACVNRRSVPMEATCSTDSDRSQQSKVLKAALALSIALEDDGEISPEEVRQNRATIEQARDALDALLGKLVRAA